MMFWAYFCHRKNHRGVPNSWPSIAALLAACATGPTGPDARTATIQRTANGVPHISAPDPETLAYAMAYAYAQDNVCMTADQLVTVRGERARWFGGATPGLLARRMFPNEQIDLFIAAHMDDAALERAWMGASAESQAMARGAVAGYNRYLADQAGKLPAACNSQPWVKPMSMAEFRRQGELTAVQAATAALADAVLGAKPPAAAKSSAAPDGAGEPGRCRPTRCARPACSTRRWAPTPGPSARTPPPTAAACCWATRTSRGPA
jgi:acyl-homoserine-lactone acylase